MGKSKSAKKRTIIGERNRQRNVAYKTKIKTVVRKAVEAIEEKSAEIADLVKDAVKTIDKTARKGIIHKNKAARKKSRLMKKANAAAISASK